MTRLRVLAMRLRGLLVRREMDDEISTHIALAAADLERRGMTPADAHREAVRQFGGVAQTKESCRDENGLPRFENAVKDIRYGFRQLWTNRGFAAAAILTLALGIGANTAIFRVLEAVVLRSLPVRAPEELVLLRPIVNGHPNGPSISLPLFREMAARQEVVQGMFAFAGFPVNEPAGLSGRLVTGGYFRVLGVNARLGRALADEDDHPSSPPVAVISDAYWKRGYGAREDVLGTILQINHVAMTVVGVAPPGFFGERLGSAPDVWLPMSLSKRIFLDLEQPSIAVTTAMARLRPDVPRSQAEAALNLICRQRDDLQMRVAGQTDFRVELAAGGRGVLELQEKFARPLLVLAAIAGLVMLLACANLANLLLARSTARVHEMGVRLALGAGRSRLIQQLLTESLLLAILGAACGLLLASWGSRELVTMASAGQHWQVSLDSGWRIVGFTALVSVAAALLFGLAPAMAATRLDVHTALQGNARTHSGSRTQRTGTRGFVVAQVAISLLLVSGASLLVRSFWNLLRQDFGYRQEGVLLLRTRLDLDTMQALQKLPMQPVYERFNAIPGVRSAALSGLGPFSPVARSTKFSTPERSALPSDNVHLASVSPRYFETMGIPILRGRPIDASDRAGTAHVVVLSETAARTLFGKADPIGRYISQGEHFDASQTLQVVGVAHDIRYSGPRDPFGMVFYLPLWQLPMPLTSVVMRTWGDPAPMAPTVRQAFVEALPRVQIAAIEPLGELLGSQMGQERMMALLSGAFGALALLMAAVGLYGVIAYSVQQRTHEIGIRVALGATRGHVSGLLMRDVAVMLAAGLVLGGAGALAIGKSLDALLFGVTAHDPAMLATSAGILSLVAVFAAHRPARRAGRLDPMQALRQE